MNLGDLLPDADDHTQKWIQATEIMLGAMKEAIEDENIPAECVQSVMIMLLSTSLKGQHGEKWRIELLNHLEIESINTKEEANARN